MKHKFDEFLSALLFGCAKVTGWLAITTKVSVNFIDLFDTDIKTNLNEHHKGWWSFPCCMQYCVILDHAKMKPC